MEQNFGPVDSNLTKHAQEAQAQNIKGNFRI